MQEPRAHLSSWLRAGRAQRRLSLDDVSRVTKIQARILEKLESGQFDGLPAEVFVRGFVKSFARCVGLDESEALERYGASLGAGGDARIAKALVDSMAELAPMTARTIEVVDISGVVAEPVLAIASSAITTDATAASEVVSEPKKKRSPRKKSATGTRSRKKKTTEPQIAIEANADAPVEIVAAVEPVVESSPAIDAAPIENVPTPEPPQDLASCDAESTPTPTPTLAIEVIDQTGTWRPTMPPVATSVPWRRPSLLPSVASVPSLVIDDADPDGAERVQDARNATKDHRVSFLPAILLDREDRSARQGGLTLAVIILLIAATLTLSYLMRRPSASGDGVTMATSADSSIVA